MTPGTKNVTLGWGASPLEVTVPEHANILRSPGLSSKSEISSLIKAALDKPIGAQPLSILLRQPSRICVLIPDSTRKDLGAELLDYLLPHLAGHEVEVGVATGKHPPEHPKGDQWQHNARSTDLVTVGHTSFGTEVAYPPRVIEADLRICLGEIRPHYFAGYAGGAKTLFPGVAGEAGIWHNHTLKASAGARLGQVDDNPCRRDMEEAAQLAGPSFIINVVRAADGSISEIVAGDPIQAHRAGTQRARPYFEVEVQQHFNSVLISDRTPVTMNLYQACKLLPPAGRILREGGTIILAAECTEGIGPVSTINEAIYRLGSVHSLPKKHRVILVSRHTPSDVAPTFADYAPDIGSALAMVDSSSLAVIPYGGDLVPHINPVEAR